MVAGDEDRVQPDDTTDDTRTGAIRCDVVLEQTLGHITHGQNLQRLMPQQPGFEPSFVPVEFDIDGWTRHLPGYGNWTVRAGVRARRGLRALGRDHDRDALFVHSQVPAVLLGRIVDRVPTIVSLDATPKQYDELGDHYSHGTGPAAIERVKAALNRRCFDRAAHLVTWAEWTKQGLTRDYGVDPAKITVVPPGVDVARWQRPPGSPPADAEPIRILFVGGDLVRKGGDDLVAAFAPLAERYGPRIELHLVTRTPTDGGNCVFVHTDMQPNSVELIELYRSCHIFCLPTRGDCLPMVLPEAGAAGLALVSTDVGAIGEIVRDGETGLLVPVNDVESLRGALQRLIDQPDLRSRMGERAAALVDAEHDAARNTARLVEIIEQAVGQHRARHRR